MFMWWVYDIGVIQWQSLWIEIDKGIKEESDVHDVKKWGHWSFHWRKTINQPLSFLILLPWGKFKNHWMLSQRELTWDCVCSHIWQGMSVLSKRSRILLFSLAFISRWYLQDSMSSFIFASEEELDLEYS